MIDHENVPLKDSFMIVDIDGTIANLKHRLHFVRGSKPDWDAFHAHVIDDQPWYDMIALVRTLHYHEGVTPFMVTGRMERCRKDTETWLDRHGVPFLRLHMRPEKDFRPDYEIKEEIFNTHFAAHAHKCLLVLDDRDQVVKMWRSKGLRCLQVQHGDY